MCSCSCSTLSLNSVFPLLHSLAAQSPELFRLSFFFFLSFLPSLPSSSSSLPPLASSSSTGASTPSHLSTEKSQEEEMISCLYGCQDTSLTTPWCPASSFTICPVSTH